MENREALIKAAVVDWNDACQSAFERIKVDSGKNITRLAADFGVRENYLERVASGQVNWSRQMAVKMAVATSQNVVRMLGREVIS